MEIIPAIDIIDGKCVRLSKGDYSSKTIYFEDPLEAARSFEDAGLKRLHIVDLDGAKAGSLQNLKTLEAVASHTNLIIDFGGGIKNIKDISDVFNAGAAIVTLGSIAVKNPGLIEEWIMEFGSDKILVGADVLDDTIKINGWINDSGVNIFEFINKMMAAGTKNIFCTDISRDGMMKGPAIELYKQIIEKFPFINLTASGGVSNIQDVNELQDIGCSGVIIGKAIYEGKITLSELSTLNPKP